MLSNNVPFGGKKQSGIGTKFVFPLPHGRGVDITIRSRARQLRFGGIHIGQGCSLELRGEARLATLILDMEGAHAGRKINNNIVYMYLRGNSM